VHLLVCDTKWIFKMHSAMIKIASVLDWQNLPVPGCFYKCHAFSLHIKSGVYLSVILSILDSSVVTLSQSVLWIVQSDLSTDTPWLTQHLHSRRPGTSQNWMCIWSTMYMFLKQSPVEIQAPNMLKLHSMTTYCLCYCLEVLFCHLCLCWLSFPQRKEVITCFKKII
jgi:hypothetical protein